MSDNRDLFHVVVRSRDMERIQLLPLERPDLDYGCRPVPLETLEGGEITVFLTADAIAELDADLGLSLVVTTNVSEYARLRQTEVGSGDRFEGGRIAPVGFGTAV